ncbi:aldose epimerase family protein [Marinobacterium rhizophilum]|uniref:aldose epimerase family protein n=1 Tax=Marinobacterium rhizophilum TaxID=420402 RepID=UPI0003AB16F8|nr:aldose epimerase family protein [Marinobacterium rhizophilum]
MIIERQLYARDAQLGDIQQYWLSNDRGVRVGVLNYGLTLTDFIVPDCEGNSVNVVLGFPNFATLRHQTAFVNATIGRYANRIAHARLPVLDEDFNLAKNEDQHHLHGGPGGFDKCIWAIERIYSDKEGATLTARLLSADGDEHYPGTLDCGVTLRLDNDNRLTFTVLATSDRATHVNITSHLYFNLSGRDDNSIKDHRFLIPSNQVVEIDRSGIPTGSIVPINDTALDFSRARSLEEALAPSDPLLALRGGIDHCYVFKCHNSAENLRMASAFCEATGLQLQLVSTQPGMQFYTGQYLQSLAGRGGKDYGPFAGFCLEPQHFPDTPNQPAFPSTLLMPGDTYKQCFSYRVEALKGV